MNNLSKATFFTTQGDEVKPSTMLRNFIAEQFALYSPAFNGDYIKGRRVAEHIIEALPLLAEGVWLTSLDQAKTTRSVEATTILIEEYGTKAYGFKARAAQRLGVSGKSLEPVIEQLKAAGQLGGELPTDLLITIVNALDKEAVAVDKEAILGALKVLAMFSALHAHKRAEQEIKRREASSKARLKFNGMDKKITDPDLIAQIIEWHREGLSAESVTVKLSTKTSSIPHSRTVRRLLKK